MGDALWHSLSTETGFRIDSNTIHFHIHLGDYQCINAMLTLKSIQNGADRSNRSRSITHTHRVNLLDHLEESVLHDARLVAQQPAKLPMIVFSTVYHFKGGECDVTIVADDVGIDEPSPPDAPAENFMDPGLYLGKISAQAIIALRATSQMSLVNMIDI